MRKVVKVFLALMLAVLTLISGLAEAGTTEPAPGGEYGQKAVSLVRGNNEPDRNVQEEDVYRTRLQAKSRKKKNTAAPKATATPAPETRQAKPGNDTEKKQPAATATPVPEGPIIDPQSIADYLFSHDMRLPDNFITKQEAAWLGWDKRDRRHKYVSDVAPGKSIGGDFFMNFEGKLPVGKGISYREADCYYTGGERNACRVVYSTKGRVWYTEDHYNTFTELFPTVP